MINEGIFFITLLNQKKSLNFGGETGSDREESLNRNRIFVSLGDHKLTASEVAGMLESNHIYDYCISKK